MQAAEWRGDGRERTSYLDLTPAVAQEWLERHHYEGQRKIRPERVEAYASDMLNGLFGASDFHFAALGPSRWMMNGRHRCHAALASNCTVRARVHDIPITTKDDLGTVYSWFDVAGLRTQSEILSAMGTEISSRLLEVTQAACNLIISGFELLPNGSGLRVRSSTALEIKRRVIEEWGPFAHAYLGTVAGHTQRMSQILRRQNVMSVGMVTMRYCAPKATPFWSQIAANDGLKPGTPQHLLMDHFLDKKSSALPHYIWARLVAHAWNFYYDGKAMKLLRVGEGMIREPILINGTPYDGKAVRAYAFADDAPAVEAVSA